MEQSDEQVFDILWAASGRPASERGLYKLVQKHRILNSFRGPFLKRKTKKEIELETAALQEKVRERATELRKIHKATREAKAAKCAVDYNELSGFYKPECRYPEGVHPNERKQREIQEKYWEQGKIIHFGPEGKPDYFIDRATGQKTFF